MFCTNCGAAKRTGRNILPKLRRADERSAGAGTAGYATGTDGADGCASDGDAAAAAQARPDGASG